jgi:hypothetical protein
LYAEAKLGIGRLANAVNTASVNQSRTAADLGEDLIAKVVYTAGANPPKLVRLAKGIGHGFPRIDTE